MKVATLKDVCEIITRGISPKYTVDTSVGVTVLNQKCIRNHTISLEFSRLHDMPAKPVAEAKLVKSGDILVNSTGHGTLGRTALAEDIRDDILVDSHITIIRPKPGLFEPRYFAYLIGMHENDFINMATGTSGQTELPRALLNEYKIYYDDAIEEQRRIVAKLDVAFEKIDQAIGLIQQNLEDVKIYPSVWLERVFTEKLDSWKRATLQDLAEFKGGGTPSKSVPEYWQGDLPWVSPKDMKSMEISDSIDHISQKAVNESSTSTIPKDSILLVVRSGILAHTIPLATNTVEVTLNQDMKAIVPKSIIKKEALFSILLALRPQIFNFVSKGATVHRINFDQLKNLPIHYPESLDDQVEFASRCQKTMDESQRLAELYEAKLTELSRLKQSMLNQAFSESAVK